MLATLGGRGSGGHDRTASDRCTAVVHGSPGTPPFGPERLVSGPNPRESLGTRGDRKAKVGHHVAVSSCKPPGLPEVDRLTRERSLVRTQPRRYAREPLAVSFVTTPAR